MSDISVDNIKIFINEASREVHRLDTEIADLSRQRDEKHKELALLQQLLTLKDPGASASSPAQVVMPTRRVSRVANAAYETLGQLGRATHYKDLVQEMSSRGHRVPGTNPPANLLAHVSGDSRFVRTSPGVLALAEWGGAEAPAPA
jgi:hypothetical protein